MRAKLTYAGIVGALLALAGCGGTGSQTQTNNTGNPGQPSSATTASPQIAITWQPRTRVFHGTDTALSVAFIFTNPATGKTELAFNADRPAGTVATTVTYTAPSTLPVGAHLVNLVFYDQTGAAGDLVGTAGAAVSLAGDGSVTKPDGTPLGNVATSGTVAALQVVTSSNDTVGNPAPITVQATDTKGNTFAVSPGSVTYRVNSGAGLATFPSTGTILGSGAGTITFTANADGITSPVTSVSFTQMVKPSRTLALKVNRMVLCPATQHIWASVPSSAGAPYGNSVIEIDPTTARVLTTIPVGSEPNALAIASDSSRLYVGLDGALQIVPVDIVGKTAGNPFPVSATYGFQGPQYAVALAVMPGNPNTVGVIQQNINSTGFSGPVVYTLGNPQARAGGIYNGDRILWTSAGRCYSFNSSLSPQNAYVEAMVTSGVNSVTGLGEIMSGRQMAIVGSKIVSSGGQVVDPTTEARVGTFAFSDQGVAVASGSGGATALILAESFSSPTCVFYAYDPVTFFSKTVATSNIPVASPYVQVDLVRYGSKGLATQNATTVSFIDAGPGL